jgi:hypothetical protein
MGYSTMPYQVQTTEPAFEKLNLRLKPVVIS